MANLIRVYEYYLLGTFLLGALQIRTYLSMIRFALSVPSRWPELYQLMRSNLNVLLTWPVIVIGSFTTGLWGLHVFLRRVVWPQAFVSWSDLAGHTGWLVAAGFFGLAMIALDGRALFRVARFQPPRNQWLLTLTDLGLRTSRFANPLRLLVGWHLRMRLVRRLPVLVHWTLRRTAEVGARVGMGLTLWGGWALGLAS